MERVVGDETKGVKESPVEKPTLRCSSQCSVWLCSNSGPNDKRPRAVPCLAAFVSQRLSAATQVCAREIKGLRVAYVCRTVTLQRHLQNILFYHKDLRVRKKQLPFVA